MCVFVHVCMYACTHDYVYTAKDTRPHALPWLATKRVELAFLFTPIYFFPSSSSHNWPRAVG